MLDLLQLVNGIALPEPGVEDHTIHRREDEGRGSPGIEARAELAPAAALVQDTLDQLVPTAVPIRQQLGQPETTPGRQDPQFKHQGRQCA